MTSITRTMIEAHPDAAYDDHLVECIEACHECAQACTACADACLAEENVAEMAKCIRSDLDCADMCEVTGRILTRRTEPDDSVIQAQLRAQVEACRACAEECEHHADRHDHCRHCAEACRRCEKLCQEVVGAGV